MSLRKDPCGGATPWKRFAPDLPIGIGLNAGCAARKAAMRSPFSGGSSEQVA